MMVIMPIEQSPENFKVLGAIVAIACSVYIIYLKTKNRGKAPLPPGPIGIPVLGNLPFLGSNLVHTFTRLSTIYGPIFKLKLGSKLVIVLSSPTIVREVVKDQDLIFAHRDASIAGLIASFGGNDIGFANYGPEWRKLRKLFVSEMMSKASLDASSHLRIQEANKMICKLYDSARKSTAVDVGELTIITLTNLVMSMVWGETLKGVKRTEVEYKFQEMAEQLMVGLGEPNISDFIPMLARFDIQGVAKRMENVAAFYGSIFESVIDEYYKKKDGDVTETESKDFIHLVMRLKDSADNSANTLSLAQVKGLFQDTVIGGTDTTTTLIEWAMTELLLRPELIKNAQDELKDVVGQDNLVEESHLSQLKYLQAIIKETLRLHPPTAMLIPHCASETTTVAGYSVPKGTQIFINAYAIQRSPQVWENPLEFQPQRFISHLKEGNMPVDYTGNDLELIPFGSGRRICPGIPLAERMSMLLLGSMLHAFDWKLPDGVELDVEEKFGIVLKKLKPLCVIPTARLSRLELYGH